MLYHITIYQPEGRLVRPVFAYLPAPLHSAPLSNPTRPWSSLGTHDRTKNWPVSPSPPLSFEPGHTHRLLDI